MNLFPRRIAVARKALGLGLVFAPALLRVLPPALGLLAFAVPRVAHAAPAVTIYTRDLAFVRDPVTLRLDAARDTLLLPGVPERIDFTSIRLVPEGAARVLRLAYRYDVASGDGVLERAKGSQVRVVMREVKVIEGTLLAVDGTWLTVREDNGSIHTLSRTAVEDVRIAGLPRLAIRPSLEAVIDGGKPGTLDTELSYLTGGLSWSAEHTLVRNGEQKGTWSANVTVENSSGRDFVDARLKLVAGEPNRVLYAPPMPMARAGMVDMAMAAEKQADLSEQSFSEYHLYTLDRPATLRDRESQRLTMIEPRSVTTTPRYLYRGGDPRGVRTQLELQNTSAAGLGVPLAGGRVRLYDTDPSGDLQFVGESAIKHTPEGEKVTLDVGAAFDLAAERREMYNKRISDREREYAVEIKLRNRKKAAVTIVVEEGVGGDVDITQPSHPFTRKDANTLQFNVPVAPGKEVVLTYTARVRY
jgi:hypothetical protein